MQKTIAMRLLEGKKVPYEVFAYPSEERDAEAIAELLGVDRNQVFKTLVVTRQTGKPLLVMIPSDRQLDLKKLAQALKQKKVTMASHKEAELLTGLEVGGISALALVNKGFSIYLDRSALDRKAIFVSAGQRGLDIKLATEDLISVTGAKLVDAIRLR